jgi:predicted O-methyltransferase YrrM
VTDIAERDLQATIQAWDQAAWSLAALAAAARDDGPPELTAAARELLAATGLTGAPGMPLPGPGTPAPRQVATQVAAALHQASALAGGRVYHWGSQNDEALLAQGHAGAQAAVQMARTMLPTMGDLAARMAAPGARMLDVGTGVGAHAVSFAQAFPQLQVLGIDILDRALNLARQAIAAGGVADRVIVRKQDVAEFADDAGFDAAWLPAPFIPRAAIDSGLPRVTAALRPGGWLILGHGKLGGTPVEDAVTQLKTAAYGGTTLDEAAACHLLRSAGLTSVRPMPTPAGAPAITIGQKPA